MNYAIAAVLIQAVIEGFKKVFPLPEWLVKAFAFAFAGAAIAAYPGLNVLAEVGLESAYPLFDKAFSVLALGLFSMVGYDVLQAIRNRG